MHNKYILEYKRKLLPNIRDIYILIHPWPNNYAVLFFYLDNFTRSRATILIGSSFYSL